MPLEKKVASNRVYAKLSDLMGWEKNPRFHEEEDLQRLIRHVARYGQFKPVIVSPEGKAIGGNKRLLALDHVNKNVVTITEEDGKQREVDRRGQFNDIWITEISFAEEELSEEQKAAGIQPRYRAIIDGHMEETWFNSIEQIMIEYGLADNDEIGQWDKKALHALIQPHIKMIPLPNFKLHISPPVSLKLFIKDQDAAKKSIVEDVAPEVDTQNAAVSQPGEVYQLGRHRLMCGDSTKIGDVEKLMDGQKADMVFTDPPYGMNLKADFKWSKGNEGMGIKPSKGYSQVIGDDKDFDVSFLLSTFEYCKEIFLWGADYYIDTLPNFGKDGAWFVWDKKNESLKGVWTNEFELLWSKQPHKRQMLRVLWNGALGTESEDISNRQHPTQKSIRVCEPVIREYSKAGQIIVDLFGGSGSTLMACEQTDRTCYMMELDPKYVDVIRKRYSRFIGQEDNWQALTPPIAENQQPL